MLITLLLLSTIGQLPLLSESQLAQLLESSKGQVLVVNFWATWCGPCREEFPDLVKLHGERSESGLKVVAISMDEPEDEKAAVQFLEDQGVKFSAYLRGFEDFEKFVNAIDPEWSGALPTTFIFDRSGKLAFRRVGKTNFKELIEEISPLLDN
jgi:thiol-disulfide isomerase/thioredoxin